MRRGAIVAGLAAGAALASGCGVLSSASAERDDADGSLPVAKVVVLMPEGGPQAAAGVGVAAAVELALGDVSVPGWAIEVERADARQQDASVTAAAEDIVVDDDVIAVVGGLSSSGLRAAQPVLDDASIPFISPADDVPEHTRGANPAAPQRPYQSYYRTTVPDDDPLMTAADYVVHGLAATVVAIIAGTDDDDAEEAAAFATQARRLGADVQTVESAHIEDSVYEARNAGATAVYVAGDDPTVAAVAEQAASLRLDAQIVGGADVKSADFLAAAGPAADRVAAVVPAQMEPSGGMPVPGLADAGAYGAAAYDAGTALALTLQRCLPPAQADVAEAARVGCASELGSVAFDGLTGQVAFDAYGERAGASTRVFVVVDGAWREVGSV